MLNAEQKLFISEVFSSIPREVKIPLAIILFMSGGAFLKHIGGQDSHCADKPIWSKETKLGICNDLDGKHTIIAAAHNGEKPIPGKVVFDPEFNELTIQFRGRYSVIGTKDPETGACKLFILENGEIIHTLNGQVDPREVNYIDEDKIKYITRDRGFSVNLLYDRHKGQIVKTFSSASKRKVDKCQDVQPAQPKK